jgi:DNA-binding LacI/PurR family transcriptional regulator
MAIGAMAALRQMGYRVPEDVSLTGFDDIGMAMTFTPHLTTVSQPLVEMGRTAIEMLDKLIRHETLDDPHRVFETQMVIRDSAQPFKNGNR